MSDSGESDSKEFVGKYVGILACEVFDGLMTDPKCDYTEVKCALDKCIDSKALVNSRHEDTWPLIRAIKHGRKDLVELLLHHNASMLYNTEGGNSNRSSIVSAFCDVHEDDNVAVAYVELLLDASSTSDDISYSVATGG